MGPRLKDQVAIVTASTKGIGLAIAERLAEEGAHVVVSSRRQENVNEAVEAIRKKGGEVLGLVCHVGRKEDRQRLVAETLRAHGRIDILVNNAAVNPVFGPVIQIDEQAWDKIMETNVKAAFLLTVEVARHMMERGAGSVVFIASTAGIRPMPFLGAYSVSKAAVLGLMRVLAYEWATTGVRVNAVAPGLIQTRFSEALWKDEGIKEQVLRHVPMQRIGRPQEVAGAVAYLCSEEASYVSGETIIVSGGMS